LPNKLATAKVIGQNSTTQPHVLKSFLPLSEILCWSATAWDLGRGFIASPFVIYLISLNHSTIKD